ncbi:unnamed protein product, partial [Durusdinium trenchii]
MFVWPRIRIDCLTDMLPQLVVFGSSLLPRGWMDRALTPFVVGASVSTWAWWRGFFGSQLGETLAQAVVSRGAGLVFPSLSTGSGDPFGALVQLSGVIVLLHLWPELNQLGRIVLRSLIALGWGLLALVELVSLAIQWLVRQCFWLLGKASELQEQEAFFTLSGMALAAGPPVPIGSFVLISRPPEWDEVMIGAFTDTHSHAICKTTNADGDAWIWVLIRVDGLNMRLPTLVAHGERRAPGGIVDGDVNWICTPPAGNTQWRPGAAEIPNIAAEANLILAQYNASGSGWTQNIPGTSGPLVEIAHVGGGVPGPLAAGGGAAAAAPPAGVGLGLGGESPSGATGQDLQALEAAVRDLQRLALSPGGKSQVTKKSKKKDRKHAKKSSKKKKRKKTRKHSGSSSDSSSSTSSSTSRSRSSRSSSDDKKSKPLRWREHGKDKSVSYADLTHVDALKLKRKGDLLAFASKHPGALTAHFLAGVYSRLSKGSLTRTGQLRDVSVTSWAHQFSGLTEVRDLKEVVTLAEILDSVNRKEISRALDIICQRIIAIQSAKQKGGSWEKAEAWFRRGGRLGSQMPFDVYYLQMAGALSDALKGGCDPLGFCDLFRSMLWNKGRSKCMNEFNKLQPSDGRVKGFSPSNVFPLPPLPAGYTLKGSVGGDRGEAIRRGGDLVLLALNWLHGGRGDLIPNIVTAAHQRVFSRVEETLKALVMTDEPTMGPQGLDHFMRQSQLYTGSGVVLALGVKGGVPDKAADVDLAGHLEEHFPWMAKQVLNPSCLLLPPKQRPKRVKRGFTWTAPSYPELVKKNVKGGKRLMYPAAQSAPMGFGPSAGWAQGLTDVVAKDADLPEHCRLHPDMIIPAELPIWGSIIDDIWGMDHLHDQSATGMGPEWLSRAEDAWCLRGVEPNSKKTVNLGLGQEVQGYYVHPTDHWVGLAMEKRRALYQASMTALMRPKIVVDFSSSLSLVDGYSMREASMGELASGSGHEVWYPWLPSKDNPADEPSRRFEPVGPEPTACKEDAFLLGSLRDATLKKYALALERLNNELRRHDRHWANMSEEEQDLFLAEWLVDGCESGASKTEYGWALSAVQKLFPRMRVRTAWKVFDAWSQFAPVRQAPAAPPEFLHALVSIAMLLNRLPLAALIVVCYAGLLRVREALQLTYADLILGVDEIVLCLGHTKRGTEQKVLLRNSTVVQFLLQYISYSRKHDSDLVFNIGYSTALRWVKRLSWLLGGDECVVTTHTFRRSGASELARQGTPMADILVYGRWQSDRAAREYVRQGEVAIHRARQAMNADLRRRVRNWASL